MGLHRCALLSIIVLLSRNILSLQPSAISLRRVRGCNDGGLKISFSRQERDNCRRSRQKLSRLPSSYITSENEPDTFSEETVNETNIEMSGPTVNETSIENNADEVAMNNLTVLDAAPVEAIKPSRKDNILQMINAAFLVAGTTIGGGFLALPSVVAPVGFVPAAVGMVGVWCFFLAQSFAMVECINRVKQSGADKDEYPGITGAARLAFGRKGEIAIGFLLTFLIQAILVAQISRAGMLFSRYRLGCLLSAFSIAGTVFGTRSGVAFASKTNAALTSIFLVSAMLVFGIGIPMADFSRLGGLTGFSKIPVAIPALLQVLAYGEIIPSVCQVLDYNSKRIHRAILIGTSMTLSLQLFWSGLGVSLASSASAVDTLLSGSGRAIKLPLFTMTISAILTTILGGYLALQSTVNDLLSTARSDTEKSTHSDVAVEDGVKVAKNIPRPTGSLLHRLRFAAIASVPASLVACISPSIFLKAISFSGSYPVIMLWGLFPSLSALFQRRKESKDGNIKPTKRSAGPTAWLLFLAAISLVVFASSFLKDVSALLASSAFFKTFAGIRPEHSHIAELIH